MFYISYLKCMIELKDNAPERAILTGVKTNDISKEKLEEHLDELEMLADTAGAETLFKIIQDRKRVDTAYFIGKGKAEEIAEMFCYEMNILDITQRGNYIVTTFIQSDVK
jgi:GTPase